MSKPLHTSVSTVIRAPKDVVFALYARWQDWPKLFPKTIRGVRLVADDGSATSIEVDHVEGRVPNRMSVVSPELTARATRWKPT